MKTVGQIFQSERKKQAKTLSEVYRKTKIPISALKKIEADQFDKLPAATFTKGFLRNYALNLKLNPSKVLAIFRRDYVETKKGAILPKELSQDVSIPGVGFNPKTFSYLSLIFLGALFFTYFVFQAKTLLTPPKISLEKIPKLVQSEEITIKGKINREAVLTINRELVKVENKKFSYPVKLLEGNNTIEIKAVDRKKKESTKLLEVKLDKP